jgi:C_GCAxxG_C_C family probable redox protein
MLGEFDMGKTDEAVGLFEEGYCCCQAVLAPFSEEFGLDKENALKVSSGFGGGMRMGATCGAVTGAFMALGLKFGPDKDKSRLRIEEFIEKFKAINGSVDCKDLMGCDITTEAGLNIAREKNLFETTCTRLVREAAEIVEEMIA